MKKKVYISGAIAHYDLKERMATFDHAARYLSIKGYEPVNPFENGVSQDAHWMEHMRVDIALLLKCVHLYVARLGIEQGRKTGTGCCQFVWH